MHGSGNTEAEELEREPNFCDIERVGEDDDGEGMEEGGSTVVALIGHATVTAFFTLVSPADDGLPSDFGATK
ncbi:hypothetical protein K0M31_006970 [Melipona bicolor]|uniref:Uncharacterized protein n=1 Tax=Melipona bicolor TaxID=60889 RepID=A0AA40KKM8_9HYME|nr:hypothetical protein K0M31_006970 [Melipona bicolor]